MKTIEKAAESHALSIDGGVSRCKMASFKAGVVFAQRWIPIEEDLPENIKIIAELSSGTHMIANMASGILAKDQVKYFGIVRWRPIELK